MTSKKVKDPKKLTKHQREILYLLNQDHMIVIDRSNMPSICGLDISPQTRYFLTDKKYVTRKDKTKSVETKGNGFIITDKGRKALEDNPPPKKRTASSDSTNTLVARIETNTKIVADNQYKKIKWYVVSTAKHILWRKLDFPQASNLPENKIDYIVNQLSADERVLKSLQNELDILLEYQDETNFIRFGEYTDNEGYTCSGASMNTIAFKRTKELLISELQLSIKSDSSKPVKKTYRIEKPDTSLLPLNKKLIVAFIVIITIILFWLWSK